MICYLPGHSWGGRGAAQPCDAPAHADVELNARKIDRQAKTCTDPTARRSRLELVTQGTPQMLLTAGTIRHARSEQ
jgi:hypothetical protein